MGYIRNNQVPLEQVQEGLSRQIMGHTKNLMLVRVFFKKGAIGYVHAHPHEQVTYVEKGKFEVEINGKKEVLVEGDAFVIEPELEHGAVCLEDGILIDTFSPRRDDFLDK